MKTIYTFVLASLLMVGSVNAQFTSMTFDAPNITGTGDMDSYSSPSTVGAQVKAAYPMISHWTGDDYFHIETPPAAYYNNVSFGKSLRIKSDNDFINIGPLDQGFISFNALYISTQTDAKFRVWVFAGNPGTTTNPSTYLHRTADFNVTRSTNTGGNWGINYYTLSYEVPAGGFIRIESRNHDDFYIDGITNTGGPMPVELTSFRSYLKDDLVELQWNTATELNNYGFEVERSVNGDDWSVLGFVEGHGTSFVPQQYSFRDAQLDRSSTELYYRLKQMDRDGTTEYSDVLRVALAAPTSVSLNAYPQPFASSLNIDLAVTSSEQVRITLYNSAMQKVKSVYEGTVDGNMSMVVPTSDLRDGSYFLIVNHSDGETQVQKLLHMQSR